MIANLSIDPEYGPSYMNSTPSHRARLSDDGITYTPRGNASGASRE